MALQQAVGTKFAIVASKPTAHTSVGFTALSFVEVGRLSEVPDLDGEYDIASFNDLTTGEETKFSDVNRSGEGELKVGFDPENTGQMLLATAATTGASVSIRFTLKDESVYYRRGIVKSFKQNNFSTGNVVMASTMIAFFGRTVKKI